LVGAVQDRVAVVPEAAVAVNPVGAERVAAVAEAVVAVGALENSASAVPGAVSATASDDGQDPGEEGATAGSHLYLSST
jgi:hypothetical protein